MRLAFIAVLLAACNSGSSNGSDAMPFDAMPFDAGLGSPCMYEFQECAPGLYCINQICSDVCANTPGGTPCNVGFDMADPMAACCPPGSLCCYDGFEHEGCYQTCPKVCPNTFADTCQRGEICLYTPGAFGTPDQCDWNTETTCVNSCDPPNQMCAGECCGSGTHCKDESCCVPDSPADAGPDAS